MDKEQFKKLMQSLKKIENNMDILVKLIKTSLPEPTITPEERKVLKLCDKKHTMEDIMKKTEKTKTNVGFILSQLRSKGLIESIKIDEKLVYRKI